MRDRRRVSPIVHTFGAALLGAALLGPARADPVSAPAPARPAIGTLRVAVDPGTGPAAGFDRELFGDVAREIGATPAFAEMSREAALSGLGAGHYDVAAGPFAPAEAAGRRWLAPVAPGGDALLKRRGDGAILSGTDIAGKAVGMAGSPAEVARLRALATRLGARPVLRPGWRAAALPDDLAAGRLAAVAGSLESLAATALARPDRFEIVGFAPRPADRRGPVLGADAEAAPLAEAVAAAIARRAADGRLATLQRKWFGIALDAAPPPP